VPKRCSTQSFYIWLYLSTPFAERDHVSKCLYLSQLLLVDVLHLLLSVVDNSLLLRLLLGPLLQLHLNLRHELLVL
jgi:hypothetical protein